MFRYAQVEAALAQAYDVDEASLGAFRGRIKHFQRIGIVPASPGKGQKLTYEREAVYRWAFCIELAEFGIDPTRIKVILDDQWNGVRQAFIQRHAVDDVLFVVRPMMMSKAISTKFARPELPFSAEDDQHLALVSRMQKVRFDEYDRAMVINLSIVRERVDTALEAVMRPPS